MHLVAKGFIMFLIKLNLIQFLICFCFYDLVGVAFVFMAVLILALYQTLGYPHFFNKVVELDIDQSFYKV